MKPCCDKEDMLLAKALKHLGLKFWRDPRSWDVKVTDMCGEHEFDGYTEDGDWAETSSAKALGKTKTFVRGDSAIWSSDERSKHIIENPFFGIRCAEELSMRLDLLGCKMLGGKVEAGNVYEKS